MPPRPPAPIAAADVDPLPPLRSAITPRRLNRRTAVFVLVGALAYLAGLIALIPARVVLGERDNLRVGGTIWRGEAILGSTMHIGWTFAPLTTLSRLGFSADWRMTGGATDLAGSATQRGEVLRIDDVSGQADGALIDALAPRLPVRCSFLAEVAIDTLVLGGSAQQASGTLRSSPARCSARSGLGGSVDLPALRGEVAPGGVGATAGTSGALMTALRREDLVEVRLSRGGALSIWPTAAAIRLAPILSGQRYDTVID